jgi:hypothetical protein
VRAFIPVNLRPLDKPLPPELGNRFGLVFLDLPVGVESPRERLRELKRRMDAIKKSPEAIVTYSVLNAIGLTPVPVERAIVDRLGAKATTVMTNVPGPRQPVYLAGTKLSGLVFWVPQSGHVGMGISIFSYAGEVVVGVAVDRGVIAHPEELVEHLHAEFQELLPPGARAPRAAAV